MPRGSDEYLHHGSLVRLTYKIFLQTSLPIRKLHIAPVQYLSDIMQCRHEEYTVLKTRGRSVTAQCSECGEIFTFTTDKDIPVPVVISRYDKSFKSNIRLPRDQELVEGELLDLDGEEIEVHSLEVGDKRLKKAMVGDITTIWALSVSFPNVVGVSVHHPKRTNSYKVTIERDAVFGIGDVLQVGAETFEVDTVMTSRGKRKSACGDEIKRLYGTPTRKLATTILEVYDG
jgi:uncharacterized Zn finger protein